MPATTVPWITSTAGSTRSADPAATPSLASRLADWQARGPGRGALAELVAAFAEAGIGLAAEMAIHPLREAFRSQPAAAGAAPPINPDGDQHDPLDRQAKTLFIDALGQCDVAAVASKQAQAPISLRPGGAYAMTLDPVNGSTNIDVNAPVGTIFGVLPTAGTSTVQDALLRPGSHQVAAGMIVYGSSTVLVLTLGEGTDSYVLDPRTRDFRLVRTGIAVPAEAPEYAINASNARHWDPGIREYIADLVRGTGGPRERDFTMRWLASLIGDAYRILVRGGIFLYPADARPGYQQGRIRLLYEANPIAFLYEQAGGAATDGVVPTLELQPASLHQRVPLVFGSAGKVARVRRYLLEPGHAPPGDYPLFATRGLFRA